MPEWNKYFTLLFYAMNVPRKCDGMCCLLRWIFAWMWFTRCNTVTWVTFWHWASSGIWTHTTLGNKLLLPSPEIYSCLDCRESYERRGTVNKRPKWNYHHHHHKAVKKLSHLLIHSGLSFSVVSSSLFQKVCTSSFIKIFLSALCEHGEYICFWSLNFLFILI